MKAPTFSYLNSLVAFGSPFRDPIVLQAGALLFLSKFRIRSNLIIDIEIISDKGLVLISGLLSGAFGPSYPHLATIPFGFRPYSRECFLVACALSNFLKHILLSDLNLNIYLGDNSNAYCRIDVLPNSQSNYILYMSKPTRLGGWVRHYCSFLFVCSLIFNPEIYPKYYNIW